MAEVVGRKVVQQQQSKVSADLLSYYRNLQSENSSKWMKDTRYKSAQLMHVQVHNSDLPRIRLCLLLFVVSPTVGLFHFKILFYYL